MGVDITTYRVRIGGFVGRWNRACVGSQDNPECKDNPICITNWYKNTLSFRGVIFSALLIRLLLLMGGIEQNPGPKSKSHDEATGNKETHEEQKSKSITHRIKSWFGMKPVKKEEKHVKSKTEKLFGSKKSKTPKKITEDEELLDEKAVSSQVSEQDEPKADNCHNGKTTTVQKSEYTVIGNNAVFIINKETKQNDLDNTDETKLEENFRENLRLSIQSWICNASFVQDCPTYLLDLIIKVESSTENSQFWKRCLADCEPLDRFFQKLLDNKTLLETTLPVVKYYLESLIPEYSLNISRTAQSISYWLQSTRVHHKRRSLLTIRPMESIADFVEQIRKFLVDMETKTISQGSSSDLDAYITSEMALAVYRLFQKLEWSSKYYEITFMQIMLLPLSYRKSSRNFEVQVEYSKLQQFFENTERQMELYLQVSNSDEKLQALLVDRLITEIKSIDQSSQV
ncbi:hypothetical protein KUTeg_024466 [Tegillarca granosa]|uniref:Uncharacterized protein n=1 Tax=Tegillarca granosa TaxID=220873 RepID=A0ABQ9DYG3_TEGGR|nr:hypothetical protein KUTeg_024466 [Tegillarca granosa]